MAEDFIDSVKRALALRVSSRAETAAVLCSDRSAPHGTNPNRLIVILPRSGFGLVAEGNADEPHAWTARNKLACFPGHKNPPTRNRAHKLHTSAVETKIHWRFEGVLLMGEVSEFRSLPPRNLTY